MEQEWTDGNTLSLSELCGLYDLPKDEAASFLSCIRIYPKGAVIIQEGDHDRTLFVLRAGNVSVHKQFTPGRQEQISQIEAINIFGEMALLSGKRRSATIVARSRNVVLYAIEKPNINMILSNPRWAEMLVSRLGKNLADSDDQVVFMAQSFSRLQAEQSRLEQELVATRARQTGIIEDLNQALSLLVEFQKIIQERTMVGSRGWAYLRELNKVTRLLFSKYIPEVEYPRKPGDMILLRKQLAELCKDEKDGVYKSLMESLRLKKKT